jgi:regulator of CtrA degradation
VRVALRFTMKNENRVDDSSASHGVTISFGDHFQSPEQFNTLFKQGMALVERSATYLDGPGRRDAKGLAPAVTVLYATESMRLTTRLLDVASWLLIRRALKQGEISHTEARIKRQSVKLQALGRPTHTPSFEDLPLALRALIAESIEMLDRVIHLDRAMSGAHRTSVEAAVVENGVSAQILQLHKAFGSSS